MAPAGKVTGFHKEGSDWYVSYNLSNPDFFFFFGGGLRFYSFLCWLCSVLVHLSPVLF